VPEEGAADQFWSALVALHQAAGKPTLSRLVHLGLEQHPPLSVSDSTINDWLNRKAIPTGRKNQRYLMVMVAFLRARVKSGSRDQWPSSAGWEELLRAAQDEKSAGRQLGRPRRQAFQLSSAQVAPSPNRWVPSMIKCHPEAPPRSPGGLIGRDSELAVFAGRITDVAAGRGSVLLIEGEPGIGKSALVMEALAQSARARCEVFWGTADELGKMMPLQPFLDALRVREPSANVRRETIARFLRGEITGHGADLCTVLAEQLLVLIGELCAASPVVIVIDDLQWADEATVALWTRLAQSLRNSPLLLIGISRPVPRRDDLLALRRVAGDDARLELGPLVPAAAARLVAFLVRGEPDERLLRLTDGAAGNPLYITELIGAMTRSSGVTITAAGMVTLTTDSVPGSLAGAIDDRLHFLSERTRRALRAAALLGADFSVMDLAVVLDCGLPDLVTLLDEARVAGVLTEFAGHLGFRHPLIRSALYEAMPPPVRIAWHRAAARALANTGAPTVQVAQQLLLWVGGLGNTADPMDDWMVNWLADAAVPLVNQAPAVAAELLSRAVVHSVDGLARAGWLAARLADALFRIGDVTRAEQVARRALDKSTDSGLFVDLHWTLGQCQMITGKTAQSLATLDRALAHPGLSPVERARLLVLVGRVNCLLGNTESAKDAAAGALAAATDVGDNWATGWALHVLALLTMEQGRPAAALPIFDRALGITVSDPVLTDLRLLLQVNNAMALSFVGRNDEAIELASHARHLACQVGTAVRLAQAHSALVQLLFAAGRWDEVLTLLAAAPDSVREPAVMFGNLGISALTCLHRGETPAARRYLDAAIPHASEFRRRGLGYLALARSLCYERDGEMTLALAVLADELGQNADEFALSEELIPDAIRLAMCTGDLNMARSLADRADELAAGSDIAHRQAHALYGRGMLNHDSRKLMAAAACYQAAGRPLQHAMALEAAAAEFAQERDHDGSRAARSSAADIYTLLGATADNARLRAAPN
jgi:tetratricopeptide (TPR) repeat protein